MAEQKTTVSLKDKEDKQIQSEVNKLRTQDKARAIYAEEKSNEITAESLAVDKSHTGGTYSVDAIDVSKKRYVKDELNEIKRMQASIALDYKDAISDVHYSIASDASDAERKAELNNRLKAHNDSYYASMFTSALQPLQEGLTLGTLFEVKTNLKMLDSFNPDAEMDKARFFSNLRDNIKASSKSSNGFIGKSLDVLLQPIDKYLAVESASSTNKSINNAIQNDRLDSLVMSPRMLACMKLNFDEQFYYDTRMLDQNDKDYDEKMRKFTADHNKAIEHVVAIAENSGYDMSAIAEEERYIVGLKEIEDPKAEYGIIFSQTASMYGIRPVDTNGRKEIGDMNSFKGDFISADGHPYTTGGSSKGSFDVAARLSESDGSLQKYKDELERNGRQYAWMIQYTESDACPLDSAAKRSALDELNSIYNSNKKAVVKRLQFDLGIDEDAAKDIYKDTFEYGYSGEMEINKEVAFNEVENPFAKGTDVHPGVDFYRELRYTTEKDIFRRLDCELPASTNKSGDTYKDLVVRNDILTDLKTESDKKYKSEGKSDTRSLDAFALDMTKNWIQEMDSSEYVNLMMHVGANMEQSYANRGTYSRHDERSAVDEIVNDIERNMSKDMNIDPDFNNEAPMNRGNEFDDIGGSDFDDEDSPEL